MKKQMKNIAIFALAGSLFVTSCGKDFNELNTDTKSPSEVPASALIANAQKDLVDQMTSTNVNVNTLRLWAQHWSQTTYVDESNYELIERDVNGTLFDRMYARVLRDLQEAERSIDADELLREEYKTNQKAIIEVMRVYAYHILVDMFGDVPYFEALDPKNSTPKYTDEREIYDDLIIRLDAAIQNLGGSSGLGSSDLIYGGDADAWRVFANSLKLRLASRMAEVDNTKAMQMAESAVADGVMTSPEESAELQYQSSPPNTNPLWVDLVQSGRTDFIASGTMAGYLNDLNDPRADDYFRNLDSTGMVVAPVHGTPASYPANSQPSDLVEDPTLPGVLLSYVEVQFLLADAAQNGYSVGGTAEDFYNAGITASILKWGGTQAEADAYIAQPEVAWDASKAEELIGTQKWIAMYNRPFEAYTTWRLYDNPTLVEAAEANTLPPTRFNYPVNEYSLNEANVRAAMGGDGDNLFGKVFWDVK